MVNITNIINKYKQMTKEERIELAKKVAVGTGIGVTGFIIGKNVSSLKHKKEIKHLTDEVDFLINDVDCLYNEKLELSEIVDRQALNIKENIDVILENENIIKDLEDKIEERDLSIMELVEGNVDRYRGIRCAIWSDEELLDNADRLDVEALKAKRQYDKIS